MFGRLTSIVLTALGFPLHLIIAGCIRAADGGPALYRSSRAGMNGVPFSMLKYRTMAPNAPVMLGPGQKTLVIDSDSRITRLGRFLRMGIDEFPQIYNIVRNEMAWVGPRPDEVWMTPKYGPVTAERLRARPGITGLAQVLDSRYLPTALGYALDIWWIRHRSLALDAWVVLVTPLFMLGWRSIGKKRLQALLQLTELKNLVAACERELHTPEVEVAGKHA